MIGRTMGAAVFALALLAACSQQPQQSAASAAPASAASAPAPAKPIEPKDARLAQLYDTSCRACHGQKGTGAPVAGDASGWAPRWSKGTPALMDSVIKGKGGMPAGGQCFSCKPKDYEALVRFMAGHEDDKS